MSITALTQCTRKNIGYIIIGRSRKVNNLYVRSILSSLQRTGKVTSWAKNRNCQIFN